MSGFSVPVAQLRHLPLHPLEPLCVFSPLARRGTARHGNKGEEVMEMENDYPTRVSQLLLMLFCARVIPLKVAPGAFPPPPPWNVSICRKDSGDRAAMLLRRARN